ncbi:30S ribosomal protein S13, partial [Candidatus Sumerlaeota bacterium]|nr:30S ribosomal protein S13 [Candidatus Sumerlaeota bacterium]
MARIAGVDLPRNKRVEVGLWTIYGIGPATSKKILATAGVNPDKRVHELTEEEVSRISAVIMSGGFKVEGDLRREVSQN